MNKKTFFPLCQILFLSLFLQNGFSQDPFFLANNQISSYTNPANTGINGSLAITTVAKTQYLKNSPQFSTAGISIEQSFPCFRNKFDIGAYAISDVEGDGLLNTNELSITGVYNAVLGDKQDNLGNIRMGITTSYVNKRINPSKLIFSDQLHPEDGNILSTNFQADDISNINRLGTSLGIVYIIRSKVRDARKWRLKIGGSFTNFTELFEQTNNESFLSNQYNDYQFINRFTSQVDFITESSKFPGLFNSLYLNVYANTVWQKNLMITQTGIKFNLNKRIVPGCGFLFSNGNSFFADTKAFICETGYNFRNQNKSDFQLNFLYLIEVGGLSNLQGNTLQFSMKYVFNKNGCKEVKGRTSCYTNHGIIYDQFWIE